MKTSYIDNNVTIITTQDGSKSLYNSQLNESYHSRIGAIKESDYVYIKNGIDYYFQNHSKKEISVFELGFGTGSNLLLVLNYLIDNPQYSINYITIEKYPLSSKLISELEYKKYSKLNSYEILLKAHESNWGEKTSLLPNCTFIKIHDDILNLKLNENIDVVFYDAFAPSKQSEVWDKSILENLFSKLNKNGFITTYCSQGAFKRNLKAIGFEVIDIPSFPFKKEIIRAIKKETIFNK